MKLERKWFEANCSVGMLSWGEMLSPDDALVNALVICDNESVDGGDFSFVVLLDEEDAAHPFLLTFCALLSVALVSFRNISSNSSL